MPTSTDIAALRSEAFGISRLFEAEKFIEKVIGLLEAERQRTENWKASFENERIRADKLAAHIEALKGDQVPVAVVDIQHGRADGNLFAVTLTKAGHALKDDVYELFTAPQKPITLIPPIYEKSEDFTERHAGWNDCVNFIRLQAAIYADGCEVKNANP